MNLLQITQEPVSPDVVTFLLLIIGLFVLFTIIGWVMDWYRWKQAVKFAKESKARTDVIIQELEEQDKRFRKALKDKQSKTQ